MTMDIDALIALVKKKHPLWDRSSKFHSNRNVLDKCWREIADEMQENENKIRKKWKYLRDQFSVEFGKIPPAGTADEVAAYEPKWRYYKSLLFLEDVVTPRVSNKNPKKTGDSSNDSESSPSGSSPVDLDKPNGSTKRRRSQTLLDMKKKLRHREKKPKRPRDDPSDEHLHFFKSLLPHVRNIPPHTLLSFRNRIQEVVEEFAYRADTANSSNPPEKFANSEPYFITCVPDHASKCEPPDSTEDQSADTNRDDDVSS